MPVKSGGLGLKQDTGTTVDLWQSLQEQTERIYGLNYEAAMTREDISSDGEFFQLYTPLSRQAVAQDTNDKLRKVYEGQ